MRTIFEDDTENTTDTDNFDPYEFIKGWVFCQRGYLWNKYLDQLSDENKEGLAELVDGDLQNFRKYGLAAGVFRNVESDIKFLVYVNLSQKMFDVKIINSNGAEPSKEDKDKLKSSKIFKKFLDRIYQKLKISKRLLPEVENNVTRNGLIINPKSTNTIEDAHRAIFDKELWKNLMAGTFL